LQIPSGPKQWPIDLIPSFPKELDQIIRWALHPEPEHRCPTAQALHEALESFVAGTPHKSDSLAGYVKKLCPEGVKPAADDTSPPLPGGVKRGSGSHSSVTVGSGRRMKPKAKSSPWSAVVLGAGLAAICALSALWLFNPSSAPAQGPQVQAALEASGAKRRATQSAALKAYLDEIEKQAAAKQFGEALYLMSKARLLEDTEVALQIRMATLGYRIERDALLAEARRHLAAGDAEAAWHVARQVLEKDPENEEVVVLLREARAKLGGRIPTSEAVR
jgi:hypothetical protein